MRVVGLKKAVAEREGVFPVVDIPPAVGKLGQPF